ncbi:GTPase HflX [Spiribacter aquaticus]|uniref:GTPase HflX n=1 Tax=Spiribacter aquaticus TaxID=1935996 RepID=A0A557RK35_9GAMM|nr:MULTISPECIES: ribosome rescue GTPase HflX [Spiribacter]KAF0279955.1 GTPase HflX [Spiribacter roseus]TVO65520.1 GTPase HflX [Spiribacter aquaticus]
MFDRPGGGENAILVQVDDGVVDADEALREFEALAGSAGAVVVARQTGRRRRPDPRTYLGGGKVDELREAMQAHGADLVLINHALSPVQERNLEHALQCRVLDRTGLILDIFAQRARSHEGKLQVELAQLRHLASRLVRGWSHLERQKGGIGLRGPGETQLELDRRMLGTRIRQLEKRLARVRQQRDQGRKARRQQDLPAVSLVGYTNAGKSTLFNRVAASGVYAADQLFATLDTTLRRIELPGGEAAVIADTVGFIRDLPPQLVAAFRSTLEEVVEAELLVHIIDAADPIREENAREVEAVLEALGADEVPQLRVYNKIDARGVAPRIDRDDDGRPVAVWLSAATGAGLDLFHAAIAERVSAEQARGLIRLSPAEGRLRARFYALGDVLDERITEQGAIELVVELPARALARLHRHEGLTAELIPLTDANLPAGAVAH